MLNSLCAYCYFLILRGKMGNSESGRLKVLSYNWMNECINYQLRWNPYKHYPYLPLGQVLLSQYYLYIEILTTDRFVENEWYCMWKRTMSYTHLYVHSLNKNLLSDSGMQIIVLCDWNILVNKVNLQSFVIIIVMMMMAINIINKANNLVMLYMYQEML